MFKPKKTASSSKKAQKKEEGKKMLDFEVVVKDHDKKSGKQKTFVGTFHEKKAV